MKLKTRKLICKIVTLGFHFWTYGPRPGNCRVVVYCKICGAVPKNPWAVYRRKFQNKNIGKVKGK